MLGNTTNRKNLITLMLIFSIACILVTICVFWLWLTDQQTLKENGQPDFNTLSESDLKKGLIVKGTIDLALDYYAEEYRTTAGTDTSRALYYLVPVYNEGENDYLFKYLITYEAEPEDYDTMDEITANTWSEQAGLKKLTLDNARIADLPSNIKQFFSEWTRNPELWGEGTFYDWCIETGIFGTDDRAAIESKFVPFMIQKTSTAGTNPVIILVLAGLSGVCVTIFLVLRKKSINGVNGTPAGPDMKPKQ